MTSQPVLELTGVQCFTIPPGQLQPISYVSEGLCQVDHIGAENGNISLACLGIFTQLD